MKALVFTAGLVLACFGVAAQAGVAPNAGASQVSQSGAKIAPSKKPQEQPQAEAERPQDKQQ
jgi:hypothetical protein